MKILDLGCGYGSKTFELMQKGEVHGIDISEEALSHAKANYPKAFFDLGDASKMPYSNGFFDEVHAYDVLEHVDDLEKTLSEASRVLKAGGKLVAEVPSIDSEKMLSKINPDYPRQVHHVRALSPEHWMRELNKHGFFVEKIVPKSFFENAFLAASFSQGAGIANQQGVIAGAGNAKHLEVLQKLAFLTPEQAAEEYGENEVKELEKLTGFSAPDLSALLLACDAAFSGVFPKTLRFECVKKKPTAPQADMPLAFEKHSFRKLFENWNRLEVMKARAYGERQEAELGKQISLLEKTIAVREKEISEYAQGFENYKKELRADEDSLEIKKKELEKAYGFLKDREKQLAEASTAAENYKREQESALESLNVTEKELEKAYGFLKDREKQLAEASAAIENLQRDLKSAREDSSIYKREMENAAQSLKIKENELKSAYEFLKVREKQVNEFNAAIAKKDEEIKTLYLWLKQKDELLKSLEKTGVTPQSK